MFPLDAVPGVVARRGAVGWTGDGSPTRDDGWRWCDGCRQSGLAADRRTHRQRRTVRLGDGRRSRGVVARLKPLWPAEPQSLGYRRPRSSRRPGPTPRRAHRGRRPGSTLGRPRPRRSHTTLGSGLPTPTRSHYPGCRLTRHPYPAGPPARVRAQQLQHRPARRSWSCSRSSPSLDEPTAWFGPASVSDRHHPWNE